jgi:hypothetical protein
MADDPATEHALSESIGIGIFEMAENAERSTKATPRGTESDLRKESANTFDWIRVNSESLSNEIDEKDMQFGKHDEQRI